MSGDNIFVNFIETHLVNRGGEIGAYLDVQATGTGLLDDNRSHYKNITLNGYLLDGVIQGFRIGRLAYSKLGSGIVNGLPDDVSRTPSNGNNAIYITASNNIEIQNIVCDRILEHGIRIGGDDDGVGVNTFVTHDIAFGKIASSRHGGSALKIAPGYSQRAYNVTVEQLVSIDSGLRPRSVTRRCGALRVSHCSNFYIGETVSKITDVASIGSTVHEIDTGNDVVYYPDTDIIELNNCDNTTINSLEADFFTRSLVSFNTENDMSASEIVDSSLTGNFKNIFIINVLSVDNNITVPVNGNSATFYMAYLNGTNLNISNVYFANVNIDSPNFVDYFSNVAATNVSRFYVEANCYTNTKIQPAWVSFASIGFRDGISFVGASKAPDLTKTIDSAVCFVPCAFDSNNGIGCGGLFTFGRRSGSRPAGAVCSYQYHATALGNAGLAFLTADGTTASDALTLRWGIDYNGNLHPFTTNVYNIGSGSYRVKDVYGTNAAINTSDERVKARIAEPDEALLRAWGKVRMKVFQFKDAIAKKGSDARIHCGVIAQEIQDAFKNEGIDVSRYGLFCHDEWEPREEACVVIDKEAVLDADGNEIEPQICHEERRSVPGGDLYSIRYAEALILEAAYQRWRCDQLENRLAALEGKLQA